MRRTLAHLSQVVRIARNALAEVILPDAIDHDARGQRIFRTRNPIGQRQAAARYSLRHIGFRRLIVMIDGREYTRSDLLARRLQVSDREDEHILRGPAFSL